MQSLTINRIIRANTLSGADFNTKRAHWTLKAAVVFAVISVALLVA